MKEKPIYFTTKVSKRNVKSHLEYNKQIVKGTRYVKIDNGTIGTGARSANIPLELILKDFSIEEITEAMWLSRKEMTKSVDHVYDDFFIKMEKTVNEYADSQKEDLDFCADDIPF